MEDLYSYILDLFICRFEMEDFSGTILNEINSQRSTLLSHNRSAFAPITPNHQLDLEDAESDSLSNNLWHKFSSSRVNKVSKKRVSYFLMLVFKFEIKIIPQ